MSHKLAPLGRTHIRHGSSTPEANSKSSSPLKEWIHTHNWGDMPSVSPELKQLGGKNTVTREVVHVAEAARFDSSSSSSDGLRPLQNSFSPDSRNPNKGFRLFLFQRSTDSTQIPP